MDELLKKRMSATQQASELEVGNEAYEKLFQAAHSPTASKFCELSIDRLRPFFTADIGFHPYPPEKLKAFSPQIAITSWTPRGKNLAHGWSRRIYP